MLEAKNQKPPLGIMPERLYDEQRIFELAGAINAYVKDHRFYGKNAAVIQAWCDELIRRFNKTAEMEP